MGEEVLHHAEGICPACGCLVDTDYNGIWLDLMPFWVVGVILIWFWRGRVLRYGFYVFPSRVCLFWVVGLSYLADRDRMAMMFAFCDSTWSDTDITTDMTAEMYRSDMIWLGSDTRLWFGVMAMFAFCDATWSATDKSTNMTAKMYHTDMIRLGSDTRLWFGVMAMIFTVCYATWSDTDKATKMIAEMYHGYDPTRIWYAVVVWDHGFWLIFLFGDLNLISKQLVFLLLSFPFFFPLTLFLTDG